MQEWNKWPLVSFDEMDSTLNVQQWIQQCIRADYKDIDNVLTSPKGVEEGVWKYEHLRQFCMELNGLAVLLQVGPRVAGMRRVKYFQDECKPETCVQMTATEQWIFLCAAHKNPKEVIFRFHRFLQFSLNVFSVPPSITRATRWTERLRC